MAGTRPVGVIVGEPEDLEPRHVAFGFHAFQFGKEAIGASGYLFRLRQLDIQPGT